MLWERIYLILVYLVVAFALVSSHLPQPDCYASYGQRIKNETLHSCTLRKSKAVVPNLSEWDPPVKEFQLNLSDSKHGILTTKFPIPDILISFEVILLINESAKTEDECNRNQTHQALPIHSKKVVDRDHCNLKDNGTCSYCSTMYVETEMHNVYTGCYMLKVAPRKVNKKNQKLRLVNRYSRSIFIKSVYEKTYIQTPNMSYEYAPHMRNLVFRLPLNQSWNKHNHLVMYSLKLNGSKGINEEKALVVALTPNITVQQCEINNPNHRHPECSPDAVGLTCRIFNVTPGNYCIKAEVLNDDRCEITPVWKKSNHSCIWIYTLVAGKPVPAQKKEIVPDGSSFYIYVGLGATAFLALFAAIIHGIRSSKNHLVPYEGPNKSSYTTGIFPKEKILLLYAHDCSLFMDLMATFRKILQKVSSWEIYDVFDPHQWGAISTGRQEWVQKLLSDDDTMIIVVDSTSAVLHQNALEDNYSINYFQPRPNSDLFTYALQAITNNVQRNVYKKIFVVRFNGFSEEGQTLRYIAPLRRYLLPDHLHQLLSSLKETSYLHFEDISHEELKDIGELQKCLDSLTFYKVKTPQYLRNVLYRT